MGGSALRRGVRDRVLGDRRFIPPPAPSLTAQKVGALYEAHRSEIRIGMLVALVASTLLFPFFAAISVQIARIERRTPLLAMLQFGGAVLLLVFFALCSMLWIAATFRPELDFATVRMLHDLSWLIFVMVFPAYTLQMVCMAVAGFIDESPEPVWPRWAAYLNLWVAVSGMGGGLAVFFKTGPFAWNGLIGFYVPLTAFAIWIAVTTYLLRRAVSRRPSAAERQDLVEALLQARPQQVGVFEDAAIDVDADAAGTRMRAQRGGHAGPR
jgi:membrane protein implicated in regulation of membrane protease activity